MKAKDHILSYSWWNPSHDNYFFFLAAVWSHRCCSDSSAVNNRKTIVWYAMTKSLVLSFSLNIAAISVSFCFSLFFGCGSCCLLFFLVDHTHTHTHKVCVSMTFENWKFGFTFWSSWNLIFLSFSLSILQCFDSIVCLFWLLNINKQHCI